MNRDKIEEARHLVEQMLDRGDAPLGLVQVRDMLRDALTDEVDEVETVYIDREPPRFGVVRPPA